jgi:hypothetical protein
MLENVLFGPSYPVGPKPAVDGQPGGGVVTWLHGPSPSKPKRSSVAEERLRLLTANAALFCTPTSVSSDPS